MWVENIVNYSVRNVGAEVFREKTTQPGMIVLTPVTIFNESQRDRSDFWPFF